jgi:hypothetical protein
MGVGLYLNGRYQPPAKTSDPVGDWLTSISTWFDEEISGDEFWGHFLTRCQPGRTYDDRPALFVSIHPAGEDVEFIVSEPGQVTVSAKTSTVGPGYHIALCQLLRRFGEDMKVHWRPAGEEDDASHDETGYFFTNNRAAVEEEMLLHLQAIARISVETQETQGHTLEAWHLPINHSYSDYPGGVRTPMGVRSSEWIHAVREDPQTGRDLYPWWEEGLTASFFLGRALCQLWTEVRWRPVLSDEEYDDWDFICDDLCRAYNADPTLNYPWREWVELIEILDGFEGATSATPEMEEVIRSRAAQVPADQPLIGYRRYPVKVNLSDDWSMRIPGAMTELWEDNTWSAWDGQRTVWFSNWSITTKDDAPVPAAEVLQAMQLPEGDLIHHRDGDLIGKAILGETEEDGEELLNLKAFSAVAGKAALCNIYYHDEDDQDWAMATWHSLTSPASKTTTEDIERREEED